MPPYVATPGGQPPQLLVPGQPAYAFGSKNISRPTVRAIVTSVAVAANVATLGIQIVEGYIPAVGDLITVSGTQTDSGAANVKNIALASVSITAATGIGTVTYAATGSNQGTTPDSGTVYIAVPEVAESCTVGKSQSFALQNTIGKGYGLSWAYTCPSQPGSLSIQLEGAINDVDAEYTIIGTALTTVSGYNEILATTPVLVNFVRLNLTAAAGGSTPTIIGKIMKS